MMYAPKLPRNPNGKVRIWKYDLYWEPEGITIEMPGVARIIHCAAPTGVPTIWAEVDPTETLQKHHFKIMATGEEFDPSGMFYVGTGHTPAGYVWHVYEVLKDDD